MDMLLMQLLLLILRRNLRLHSNCCKRFVRPSFCSAFFCGYALRYEGIATNARISLRVNPNPNRARNPNRAGRFLIVPVLQYGGVLLFSSCCD